MTNELDIDPALFGVWPKVPVYDGLRAASDDTAPDAAPWRAVLDTKAQAAPLDELQDMLNGMTKELRMQLQQFQALREEQADRSPAGAAEIDRKQTQADAKASIEAMSLIVRTLEKIDSLQRTIAHDRRIEAEREIDEDDYDALVAAFHAGVELRAQAIVAAERRGLAGGSGDAGDSPAGASAAGSAGGGDAQGEPP